ncbi:AI-2E family transporter [Phenylobacterium immobile]|uniref:AI-2E family transporter n=1 Tax=Phenylobacterium immobile TaxID=21 RepID=UPI001FE13715|nr:AI-2E family transporter [Phenylobacterium immobile]
MSAEGRLRPWRWAWLAIGLVLAWRLADVLLMAFGAVLVAILLDALSRPLVQRLHIPRKIALSLSICFLAAAAAAALWLFGSQATVQAAALGDLLPRAWEALRRDLSTSTAGAFLLRDLETLGHVDGLVVGALPKVFGAVAESGVGAVIVMFAGLYLAFHPATYLSGALRLVPPTSRPRAAAVVRHCGEALNRWLVGQMISMIVVGASVGLGLWAAGTPSPLALGVLAGLGQFVPVVGPMAATLPGLLVASGAGPNTLIWTAIVYLCASQAEANVLTPLVLRQMVELPMALTLFAVLAMGVLLGPLGVFFATPLAIVAHVLVRRLYVEDVLGDRPSAQEGMS